MELIDVVKTFELSNKDRDHLNGFLENGWRIVVILRERVTEGEHVDGPYDEQVKYVLGADDKNAKLGKSFQERSDNMDKYVPHQ